MKNQTIDSDYEKFKTKAKKFYNRIGPVHSPPLKDSILFNSAGFRHLLWKGKELRPKSEQKRRFALLHHAPHILTDSDAKIIFRREFKVRKIKKHGQKISKISEAKFWAMTGKQKNGKITVIIRQIDNGNKHFFSIF